MNIPQCFFEFETDAGSKMFVEGRGSIVRAGNVGTGGRWGALPGAGSRFGFGKRTAPRQNRCACAKGEMK